MAAIYTWSRGVIAQYPSVARQFPIVSYDMKYYDTSYCSYVGWCTSKIGYFE